MQILESSVTTNYNDGSSKTRIIEGTIPPEGEKNFSPIGRSHIDAKPGVEMREFNSKELKNFW